MIAKPVKKTIALDVLRPGTVVLALDVSSAATGWAVGRTTRNQTPEILDFGVDRPPSGWDFQRKVFRMMTTINRVIGEHEVTSVCMEFQSHKTTNKRVQGLAVLGQAQGAIWNHIVSRMPVDRISEREWTKLGGRNTRKESRCEFVKLVVPAYAERSAESPRFDPGMDAADALGLLLYRASIKH